MRIRINYLGALLFAFILPLGLLSQNDVVLKFNGEEMIGKVMSIDKSNIEFVYQNETLEYSVPIAEIQKITFGSGRIQYFNNGGKVSTNLKEHHNKVAILPFGFLQDKETSNMTMTKKIQQETFTIFRNEALQLKFQDPTETNALLSKAGITNNIEGYTMGEICDILGVEYVVQGIVSIEKTDVTNYSSSRTKVKGNNNKARVDKKGNIIGNLWNNSSKSSSSFSTTSQNYSTNITMNVYTDKGENIYSKDHSSFWLTENAYRVTLRYLAKRTPLFGR